MQIGYFAIDTVYNRLDAAGDSLARLNKVVNWEGLRPLLGAITFTGEGRRGRPAWDAILIVKCLILQAYFNIADGSCEYQINDRLSFQRFLGLELGEKAPDEKTIWLYRERIKKAELESTIFAWFEGELNNAGFTAQKGQIIDATFVPTHKPTGKQQKQETPLTPAQICQIDPDATFTKKREETHHGYKNHISIDSKHKLIRQHSQTTASRHDSQELDNLLQPTGDIIGTNSSRDLNADSAYRSAATLAKLKTLGYRAKISHRAYRNTPLTDAQKATNTTWASTRARVEHVFGHVVTAMGGFMIHTIGKRRAEVKITFKNLAYNMQRATFLTLGRKNKPATA
jgi:transposase, IS5 family